MRKQWKGFILGVLITTMVFTLAMPVAAVVRNLKADYLGIKITLDGRTITPKDANGKTVEPFAVDGTTYLPLRAVAEALGLDVNWHGPTKTVQLYTDGGSQPPAATPKPTPRPTPPSTTQSDYRITYQNSNIYQHPYSDNVYYFALVEVENTGNVDLYLDEAVFDFESRNGVLLASDDYTSVACNIIAPGEKGYFYGSGSVTGKLTVDTDYVFKPKLSIEPSKLNIVRYDVSDVRMNIEDETTVSFVGRVTNRTDEEELLPNLKIVLYRADGTPIQVEHRNISTLKAGDTTSFDTSPIYLEHMGATASEVASFKIFSCKTQWQF